MWETRSVSHFARGAWHGPTRTGPHRRPLRTIWEGIRRRCEDPSDLSYRYYGARGIRLGADWKDFRAFHRWAVKSGYEPGMCLALRGGRRVYGPRNGSWITRQEAAVQARHLASKMPPTWTIEAFGECKGPTEWSRDGRCEVSSTGLLRRLRAGWPPEDAISTPPQTVGRTGVTERVVTAFETTKSVTDGSRDRRCKVTPTRLRARLDRGIRPQEAISRPPYGLGRCVAPAAASAEGRH